MPYTNNSTASAGRLCRLDNAFKLRCTRQHTAPCECWAGMKRCQGMSGLSRRKADSNAALRACQVLQVVQQHAQKAAAGQQLQSASVQLLNVPTWDERAQLTEPLVARGPAVRQRPQRGVQVEVVPQDCSVVCCIRAIAPRYDSVQDVLSLLHALHLQGSGRTTLR